MYWRPHQKTIKVFEITDTRAGSLLATLLDEIYAKEIAQSIRDRGIKVHVHERYRPVMYVLLHLNEFIFNEV